MAETSYIIQNGRRLNLKDSTARKSIGSCDELQTNTKHCLVMAINELNEKIGTGGSGESDYLPLKGGTMTGEIAIGQGDGKGIQLGTNGRLNATDASGSTTCTVLGSWNGACYVGHSSFTCNLRGAGTRPMYNSKSVALLNDTACVGSIYSSVDSKNPAEVLGFGTWEQMESVDAIPVGKVVHMFGNYGQKADDITFSYYGNGIATYLGSGHFKIDINGELDGVSADGRFEYGISYSKLLELIKNFASSIGSFEYITGKWNYLSRNDNYREMIYLGATFEPNPTGERLQFARYYTTDGPIGSWALPQIAGVTGGTTFYLPMESEIFVKANNIPVVYRWKRTA